MIRIEYALKDGRTIINPDMEYSQISGIENLVPTIENLREKDGNFKFKDINGELQVKATDIVSVKCTFI